LLAFIVDDVCSVTGFSRERVERKLEMVSLCQLWKQIDLPFTLPEIKTFLANLKERDAVSEWWNAIGKQIEATEAMIRYYEKLHGENGISLVLVPRALEIKKLLRKKNSGCRPQQAAE